LRLPALDRRRQLSSQWPERALALVEDLLDLLDLGMRSHARRRLELLDRQHQLVQAFDLRTPTRRSGIGDAAREQPLRQLIVADHIDASLEATDLVVAQAISVIPQRSRANLCSPRFA